MVNFRFEKCTWGRDRLARLKKWIKPYFEGLSIDGIDEVVIIINKPDFLVREELSHYESKERTEEQFKYLQARWDMHNVRGLVMETGPRNYILVKDSASIGSIRVGIPHELAHFIVGPFTDRERMLISDAVHKWVVKNMGLPKRDPVVWSILDLHIDTILMLNEELAAEYALGQRWPEIVNARLKLERGTISSNIEEYRKVMRKAIRKYPGGITMGMVDRGEGRELIHAKALEVTLTFVAVTGPLMSAMLTGSLADPRIRKFLNEVESLLPTHVYDEIIAFLKAVGPDLKKYRTSSVDNAVEISTMVLQLLDELF